MELSLILKRVWRGRKILRYILHSVFFNFHYLPFREAVKLPILLYKPKLLKLKGTIKIKQEDKNRIWNDTARISRSIIIS